MAYTDDFNRTTENPIASPWSTDGVCWLKLESNAVSANDTVCGWSSGNNSNTDGLGDQYSQVEYVSGTTVGVMVRSQASPYQGYAYTVTASTGAGTIWASGLPVSGSHSGGGALSPGDTIKLKVVGYTLYGYINGDLKITTTDTYAFYATGRAGIKVGTDGVVDNWEGGDIEPDPLSISVADCHAAACVF